MSFVDEIQKLNISHTKKKHWVLIAKDGSSLFIFMCSQKCRTVHDLSNYQFYRSLNTNTTWIFCWISLQPWVWISYSECASAYQTEIGQQPGQRYPKRWSERVFLITVILILSLTVMWENALTSLTLMHTVDVMTSHMHSFAMAPLQTKFVPLVTSYTTQADSFFFLDHFIIKPNLMC